jgi:cytochrome c-type biogenesis protein CcmF
MLAEIGNLFLFVSLVINFGSLLISFFTFSQLLKYNTLLAFGCSLISFLILIVLFVESDFSVKLVFENSHQIKPLIYKISAAWGNHEGSMLLWVLNLEFINFLFAFFSRSDHKLKQHTIGIQSLLAAVFLLFVIFFSNPFERLFPPPITGKGLNPILQDIGLALHPPMLYLGYVGFSIAYSIAISGLITGKFDSAWAIVARPWVMFSWAFLTLGIGLGSWWAYRELGWGGYWYWDPVENSSLMPWLSATALIHCLYLNAATGGGFRFLCILLSILTFGLSLIGTFLVRSGLITSVHSFAVDPTRGYVILVMLSAIIGFGLLLFAFFGGRYYRIPRFKPFSRQSFMLFSIITLLFFIFCVLSATLFPLLYEMLYHNAIAIDTGFYAKILKPITLVLLTCLLIATNTNWTNRFRLHRVYYALITATFLGSIYLTKCLLSALIVALAFAIIIDSLIKICKSRGISFSNICHLGITIITLAIALNTALSQERIMSAKLNEIIDFAGFKVILKDLNVYEKENYITRIALFDLYTQEQYLGRLPAETRFYPIEKQQTTEAAIYHDYFYDLYISVSDIDSFKNITVRIYYRPMVGFIWFGCLTIFFGALLGLLIINYRPYKPRLP